MTDGVARELEQAEARLSEARLAVRDHDPLCEHYREPCSCGGADLVDALVAAAIEVGRLRALAEVEHREWHHSEDGEQVPLAQCEDSTCVALAAREEVQG